VIRFLKFTRLQEIRGALGHWELVVMESFINFFLVLEVCVSICVSGRVRLVLAICRHRSLDFVRHTSSTG
jgi:hypothetical protein